MTSYFPAVKAAIAGTLLAAGSAASAATLVFVGGDGDLDPVETDYANFDSTFGIQSGVSGTDGGYNTGVFAAAVGGIAAEPAFGDQTDAFYAVLGGGSVTFSFAQAVGRFGFDLGSADDYNSVTLNFLFGPSETFTGAQLNPPGPATGNQIVAGTNGRVTIFSFGDRITSVQFNSDSNSFEFDNLGIGAIPEPSVWAMLILGFGVIGGALRRRTAKGWALRASLV